MAQGFVTIESHSGREQRCLHKGRLEILLPYSTRDVMPDLAAAFISQNPGRVREYAGVVVPEPRPGQPTAWLANATGNPFAPATIKVMRIRKSEEIEVEIPNPVATVTVVKRKMSLGMKIQRVPNNQAERESLNLGFKQIVIPPYQRVCVEKDLADWMIRRDLQSGNEGAGRIVICDAPSTFEPNISWPLEELWFYSEIVGIPQEHMSEHYLSIEDDEDAVLQAKNNLLRLVYFRLIDSNVMKPMEDHFRDYIKATKAKPKTIDDMLPPVSKRAPAIKVQEQPTPRKQKAKGLQPGASA